MTNGIAGAMRHRITLMGEEFTQGAGGRMTATSPIIANVWARMDDPSSAKTEQGDKQYLAGSITFETWFQQEYTAARFIEFGPNRYKVQLATKKGLMSPKIEFQTVLI